MKMKDQTKIERQDYRYLDRLSKKENEMLDIIADIIVKHVLLKGDEANAERRRQADLNCQSSDFK